MPYRKGRSKKIKAAIPPALYSYFTVGHYDNDQEGACDVFLMELTPKMKNAWLSCREEVMPEWIKKNPCTRCYMWWKRDAPEPRRRLGGIGTPAHEVLAYAPLFSFGIPVSWVDQWAVDYYNGRALDIHGNPIGTEYKEGGFRAESIDPKNPPCFSSEAAYLQRHDLLTTAERKYLDSHPELMELEKIEFEENEED